MEILRSEMTADFYFGYGEEDHEAYDVIVEARIPCRFLGFPWDAPTPMLVVNGVTFIGLVSIREFVASVTDH